MDSQDLAGSAPSADAYLVTMTADIASAYVTNNSVQSADLPKVLETIFTSLRALGTPKAAAAPEKATPHISIKKTITPDYIISLEDGRHYKSLKRHLTGRDLTPQEYRTKWGLPHDYPMVAESYAARRSALAKSIGLGRKKAQPASDVAVSSKRAKKAA